MRADASLIALLCCLGCGGRLELLASRGIAPDGHVMEGELKCPDCGAAYPVRDGVARFAGSRGASDVARTIDGFGYEWTRANRVVRNTEFTSAATFLDFIAPIGRDYFAGKTVLDGGCGTGRFSVRAREFGASVIVGVDLSDAVNVAFENTRALPNVLIIQADLFRLPLRVAFDYVFTIGVLHHTADPSAAFKTLVALLKPGGGISVWVYGRENNEWIVEWLTPIRRRLTSRLPRGVLLATSYLLAVPLFLALKAIYRPVGRLSALAFLRKRLFYFGYLHWLSRFGFREQAYIVFDHLVPAIAEYIPRDHVEAWFREAGLSEVVITSRAGNSWRGFGVRSPLEPHLGGDNAAANGIP